MFTGHFGPAFAAKAGRPELSLGGQFVAAQLPDVVFSILVATGTSRVRVHANGTGPGAVEMVSVPFSHAALPTSRLRDMPR
ncbi:hypothetical protein FB384_000558 [Prauserella sediminis]|uniref:Uncharacterized protein n=1 Tax=Prauserella sediminis TaxID=577680 RepID=A0A839XJC1_9PSEU|nr:hypothetical protein [Prauserella sediminis]MBB3661654.1 hypothetical protein [Prauserella sediminis]